MSQSTHLVGFKPADEKFQKMYRILAACRSAEVDPPEAVKRYFGSLWEEADERGVQVPMSPLRMTGVTEWGDGDTRWGIEVDLRVLDPDVKILRFYNLV